jgi:murein L,D-transpeptidase YafK
MSFQMKALYRTIALTTLALMIPTGGARAQLPEKKLADRIVVAKSARTMTLEINGHVLRTYRVALGGQPVGAKERQGDHKTPEGDYIIDAKNAHSQFYMELHISYPNAVDRARARNLGVSPGGDVEIHGLGKQYGWIGARHRLVDWTDGCIAVTNEEIQEIFGMVPVGTRVEIRP